LQYVIRENKERVITPHLLTMIIRLVARFLEWILKRKKI